MPLYSDLNQERPLTNSKVTDVGAVLQSIRNILTTTPGARFFNPLVGSTLAEQLFELGDDVLQAQVETLAFEAITNQDPRVQINYARSKVEVIPDNHQLDVALFYDIQGLDGPIFTYEGLIDIAHRFVSRPQALSNVETQKDSRIVQIVKSPISSIVIDVTRGAVPFTVNVDSSSIDVDGEIVGYEWDWGDGTAKTRTKLASHTYLVPGNYDITLKVIDNSQLSDSFQIGVIALEYDDRPLNPERTTYRVRRFDGVNVSIELLTWSVPFNGGLQVPYLQGAVWDGTYKYLFPEELEVVHTDTSLIKIWLGGVLKKVWRWGI